MKTSNEFQNKATVITSRRRVAMILILITDVGLIAWGAMAALLPDYLLGPGSEPILKAEYESYTHLSWSALTASSPSVAEFITILFRMYGTFNVVFGLMAVAIAATAFRRGERWAWWALLVGNTIALGSAMTFDRVINAIGIFEITEYVGIVAVYVALAITVQISVTARQLKSGTLRDPHTESVP
jgi:hypothetical protein